MIWPPKAVLPAASHPATKPTSMMALPKRPWSAMPRPCHRHTAEPIERTLVRDADDFFRLISLTAYFLDAGAQLELASVAVQGHSHR